MNTSQNMNLLKKEISLTNSFGAKNILIGIAAGKRNLRNKLWTAVKKKQKKTQIFYFQQLWRYVVLFLWGENVYNGYGSNGFKTGSG